MSRQNQDVRDGSIAIQSGEDTNIYQGASPSEIREIVQAVSEGLLPSFIQAARETANERMRDFGNVLLAVVNDPNGRMRPEAFKDPDFQYLLTRAEHAYARSGDQQLRDTLIDLIARRSREVNRTRLSLTLNEAVEKAAVLTKNEFAELSLAYLFRHVGYLAPNPQAVADFLNKHAAPLLPDVTSEDSSYWYLEAQSCAKIEMTTVNLDAALRHWYSGVLATGIERKQLEDHLPDGKKNALDGLLLPSFYDASKLRFNSTSRGHFHQAAANIGLNKAELDNVYNALENTVGPEGEIVSRLEPLVPEIRRMFELWKNTPLHRLSLTAVGIAVAHANLVRIAGLDADLSLWIK